MKVYTLSKEYEVYVRNLAYYMSSSKGIYLDAFSGDPFLNEKINLTSV